MFRHLFSGLTAYLVATALGASNAQAALAINAAVGAAPVELSFVTFDELPLGSGGGITDGITVLFADGAQAVQGSVGGDYAEPYLSNSNGFHFDHQSDGLDTTTYLSTGLGKIMLILPSFENDIGLLWGSVDWYNTLDLYAGTTLVGSMSGTDVTSIAAGNQGVDGTFYVNIHSTLPFDAVVALSSQYSFEFDDVAFDSPAPMPEPGTMALLGIGVISLGYARRKLAWKPIGNGCEPSDGWAEWPGEARFRAGVGSRAAIGMWNPTTRMYRKRAG